MIPLLVSLVALIVALVLVGVLVRRHTPESGLASWLGESFRAWRGRAEITSIREESAWLAEPSPETGDIKVGDILDMAEPGAAYHRPVDLREMVGGRRDR